MPVKRSQSAARVLTVFETIATHQPMGVRALAKLLDEDKSAIHRALMTLADRGWIRTTSEPPPRWEVTAHILAVAYAAHGNNDLRTRSRPTLEQLRDETGETVLLVLPDVHNFIVIDVIESRQMLRMVPHIGTSIGPKVTATGRAVLPFLDLERQIALLGAKPDRKLLDLYELTRTRGYATSEGEVDPSATNLAAPIFDFGQHPIGAVVVCGPSERLNGSTLKKVGEMVARTADTLSRAIPDRATADKIK